MTLVTFRNGRAQRMFDVAGTRTFTLPATGQAGEAQFRVPYAADDYLRDVIDSGGSSLVIVHGQGQTEPWHGVVTGLEFDSDAVQVTAHQPWILLGKRNVSNGRVFTGWNAGQVMGAALREALGGMGGFPLRYTTITDTPPHIDYEFRGQDVMSVAQDLMALSGQELMHAPKSPRLPILQWGGQHARATYWPDILVAGSSFLGEGYSLSILDRVSRVNARADDGRSYSAWVGEPAARGWPAELTIQGGTTIAALMNASEQELIRLVQPGTQITGGVPRLHPATGTNLWNILERDFVRVMIPRARFTGATATCRVLARTRSDDSLLMTLELQVMGDPAAQMNLRRPYGGVTGRPARGSGRSWFGRREIHDLRRRLFDVESRRA